MVVCYHWLPSVHFLQFFHIGPLGVGIFFVLSGFLITRILIEKKEEVAQGKINIGKTLLTFYQRRFLRIFPIYYLFLAFLFGLNFEAVRNEIWWHGLYLSNVLYAVNGEFSNGLSHLWSLSVEEQFYILWPITLLVLPKKWIKGFMITSICIGIISYLLLTQNISNGGLLVIGRIDAFAWGGLLAFYYHSGQLSWIYNVNNIAWFVLALFIGLHFLPLGYLQPLRDNIFYVLCFFIISNLIGNRKGIMGHILEFPPIIYIGKISYGIYLYHNIMQWLIPYFTGELNIPFPSQEQEYLRFFIYLAITFAVSSLSWFVIEKPLLRLKSKYN